MKSLFVICLLTFLLGFVRAVSAQPVIPNVSNEKLSGPAKSLEHFVISYWMADGKPVPGEPLPSRSLRFDPAGSVVENSSFDHKGKLIGKNVHTFDALGLPNGYRSYSSTTASSDLTYVQDYLFKRDPAGRVIEYLVTEGGGSVVVKFTYRYDNAGNLVEEAWHSHLGTLGGKSVSTYEADQRRKTETHYNAAGEQIWKNIQERDTGGRVIWRRQYRGTTLKYEIETTYDVKGRPLEETTTEFNIDPNVWVSHSPRPGRLVYRYDDEKKSVELSRLGLDGKLEGREVRFFDTKGNEIEMAEYGPDGKEKPLEMHFYNDILKANSPYRGSLSGRRITQFEYDRHGNWTRKRQYIRTAGDAASALYREEHRRISYF